MSSPLVCRIGEAEFRSKNVLLLLYFRIDFIFNMLSKTKRLIGHTKTKQIEHFRATLPLTDTKELLSPDCLCSHSSNHNGSNVMNDLTNISNACCSDGCDEHCVFSNEPNQNGIDDPSPRRHSSMDQLMGLLHEMGKSRQRSLSDGQDEGLSFKIIKKCCGATCQLSYLHR